MDAGEQLKKTLHGVDVEIYIDVVIAGKKRRALLDSGCRKTVLP